MEYSNGILVQSGTDSGGIFQWNIPLNGTEFNSIILLLLFFFFHFFSSFIQTPIMKVVRTSIFNLRRTTALLVLTRNNTYESYTRAKHDPSSFSSTKHTLPKNTTIRPSSLVLLNPKLQTYRKSSKQRSNLLCTY